MDEKEYDKRYTTLYNYVLGNELKKWRQHRSLTQYELGTKTFMNPEHISRIEYGKHKIYTETLNKFYKTLDIDMNDFFKTINEEVDRLMAQQE